MSKQWGVSAIPKATNPLDSAQREKSGATTFGKYEYQYHWALARALEEHKASIDYVVLVEHHEDVVLIKPARVNDPTSAKFFFHQVKNVNGRPYTANDLIKRTKTNNNRKNSVLGKLVQGTHGKPFNDQIDSILIVATCGFSLPQIKANQNYQEIRYSDLTSEAQKQLHDAMKTELGCKVNLSHLRLLKPSLGAEYGAGVIHSIVELLESKSPGSMSNPKYIYLSLIDELHRRGVIPYDYQAWDKLIQEKALSGNEVEKTLQIHSIFPEKERIKSTIQEVGSKLGISTIALIKLPDAGYAYYLRRKFTNSLEQMRVNSEIDALVNTHWKLVEEDKIQDFSNSVKAGLTTNSTNHITSFEGLDSAIATEIVLKSLGIK